MEENKDGYESKNIDNATNDKLSKFESRHHFFIGDLHLALKAVRKRCRANGEGSIRKVGKSFEARVTVGFDNVSGKQMRKAVRAKTRAACKEEMDKLLLQIKKDGPLTCKDRYTIREWLTYWLDNFKRKDCALSTIKNYENVMQNHIFPLIGDMRLEKLKTIQAQQLLDTINTSKSTRMVEMVHNTLNASFAQAVRLGILSNNPITNTVLPRKKTQGKAKALTYTQQEAFILAAENCQHGALLLTCLFAGLRRGEAVALRWEAVDLQNRLLTINSNASTQLNPETNLPSYDINKTKTVTSMRKVPISQQLYNVLNNLEHTSDFVFPSQNGTLLQLDKADDAFKNARDKADLSGFTLHDLRHTFATRCMEAGIPVKVVQVWLGHAKSSTTMDIYMHVNAETFSAEIAKLNTSDHTPALLPRSYK